MSALERSEVWRHLARALAQIGPLAENRMLHADERARALEHLTLVAQASSTLFDRKELTRYEARLIDSEIGRLRFRLQQPAPQAGGRTPVTPAVNFAQAAFERINKLQSALTHMAESGECHPEVLRCVRRGLEADLAILSDPQQLLMLPDEKHGQVRTLVHETQRHLQTIIVQQEIQAAMDDAGNARR